MPEAGAGWVQLASDASRVVIVSSHGDPHVTDMVQALYEMSCTPFIVDSEAFPLDAALTLSLGDRSGRWHAQLELAHREVLDFRDIRSVWWRRPGHYFGIPTEFGEQQREFVKEEMTQAFYAAWKLPHVYWVNNPETVQPANWKIEQLARAARLGFEIPRTVVTNDPQVVRDFYDQCNGKMIYKVLSEPGLGAIAATEKHPELQLESRRTLTTLIGREELKSIDSVRMAPGLFQEYVDKVLELRVTVIGDDIFVAEIYSQERDGTKVDWRNWAEGGLEIEYRAGSLPSDVQDRCFEFVRSYGLNFSTMDIVVTADGRYVFLENNANGNFIWVEKRLPELKLTAALAACLVRGTNS